MTGSDGQQGHHAGGEGTAPSDLLSLVRAAEAAIASTPLLTVGEVTLTARQFRERVEALAAGLLAAGLGPGQRVAVLLERSVEEAVVLLAAAAAGGIAVPCGGKLKDDQIGHLLRDSDPWAVVTSRTRLLALREPRSVLHGRRVIAVGDGPMPVAAEPYHGLRGDPAMLRTPAADAAAVLLYTSGSTGLAKGVVQTHGNLTFGARVVADMLGLRGSDHLLAVLPISFDYGLNQLLSALHVPCRITAADHLGTGELAEQLLRVEPTGLAGVPSLFHEIARGLRSGVLDARHGRSLRYLTNSGGALRRADSAVLRAAWPHVSLFAMYGLTEAFRSAYLPPSDFDRVPESFGRAIEGVELLLVEPATGKVITGPGQGELVHAGALVAKGYWNNPEATAARFRPDPRGCAGTVVYSGDLVRRDAEGLHWFASRMDRLLKVHGHRVSPDEVAGVFAGMPGVGEVAVFGVDGEAAGHRIHVAIAGDPDHASLRDGLWRRARARLPSYMLPAGIHVLTSLPHNAHGKVDEAELRRTILPCTDDR
ncbi:MAG: AMP-binding protein [Planctomycetes bacterium]|nr:AMP-binding protein [Planctomycetota bacterium]